MAYLVVCRSHSRLDVIAFLELFLLQFLTQNEDGFLQKLDFKIGTHCF